MPRNLDGRVGTRLTVASLLGSRDPSSLYPAAGQYVSLAAGVSLNVGLSLVMSPADFGAFSFAVATSLFALHLADPGINYDLATGRGLRHGQALTLKAILVMAVAAYCWIMAGTAKLSLWMWAAMVLVALGTALFSGALSEAARLAHWQVEFRSRLFFAVLHVVVAIGLALVGVPPSTVILGIGSSYIVAWYLVARKLCLGRGERVGWGDVTHLPVFGAIAFPGNMLSNGLLSIGGLLAPVDVVAGQRLAILAVGGLIAFAPVSAVHLSAITAQFGAARAWRRWAGAVLLVSGITGIMAPSVGPLLLALYGNSYAPFADLMTASVLQAPLLVGGSLSLAIGLPLRGRRSTGVRGFLCGLAGASAYVLSAPAAGSLLWGLAVLGWTMLLSTVERRPTLLNGLALLISGACSILGLFVLGTI